MKKIYPIISITIVVFLAVTALGFVYAVASPMIEYQRELRKLRMLEEIFPEMTLPFILEEIPPTELIPKGELYRIYYVGDKIGYAFITAGIGFGGHMTILVGIKEDMRTLKGIGIVAHLETPGLGARITEREFLDMFAGLESADVALRRDDGRIDAITAATISSRTVADTVRKAMEEFKVLERE